MLFEMHPNAPTTLSPLRKYSAKNMAKPINFFCVALEAQSVAVSGDFTGWHPQPMARQPDGSWKVTLPVHHGHHRYVFVVDGTAILDPRATGVARNERNERVSLLAVS